MRLKKLLRTYQQEPTFIDLTERGKHFKLAAALLG